MPVSGTSLMTPPMMMNACTPMIVVRPTASSFSNGALGAQGGAQPGADDEQVRHQHGRCAEQAELLADRGEDEVVLRLGHHVGAAEAEAGAAEPPSASPYSAWTIW